MRFNRAVLAVSLLLVCFMLPMRFAKADTITFHDLADGVTVTTTGTTVHVTLGPGCGTLETCTVILAGPAGTTVTSPLPTFLHLAEPRTNPIAVSDGLAISAVPNSPLSVQLLFMSDPALIAGVEGTIPGAACVTGGCPLENGLPQLMGTVTWAGGASDDIYIQSDVEPEPASLILFGSGLAITGGFLRRRRRQVAPSV